MKPFNGYEAKPKKKGYPQLPAGPYVAKIMAAKVVGDEPDQTLIIRLDVAEGEWAGYYAKRYQHDSERENSQYPAKYKGDFRLRVPNPNNKKAMYPERDKENFGDAIYKIQESNPGYDWDWNESGLKGLLVGINVQQGSYNGNQFTRIAKLEIVDEVRSGKVDTLPPSEPRSDAYEPAGAVYTPPAQPPQQLNYTQVQGGYTQVETDELPFDRRVSLPVTKR